MKPNVHGLSWKGNARGACSIISDIKSKKKSTYSRERLEEDINICLNCQRPDCNGKCKKITNSRKEASRARRSGEE